MSEITNQVPPTQSPKPEKRHIIVQILLGLVLSYLWLMISPVSNFITANLLFYPVDQFLKVKTILPHLAFMVHVLMVFGVFVKTRKKYIYFAWVFLVISILAGIVWTVNLNSMVSEFSQQEIQDQKNIEESNKAQGIYENVSLVTNPEDVRVFRLDPSMSQIPDEVFNFKNLEALTVNNANFSHLSSKIGQLTQLRSLTIATQSFSEFPQELFTLANLEKLAIVGYGTKKNEIKNIPEGIENLKNMRELDFSENKIVTFPIAITSLTRLASLDLSRNEITSLPPQIGQLTELRELRLSGNMLTTIPSEIGNLKKLKVLYIIYQNNGERQSLDTETQKRLRELLPNTLIY